MMYTSFSEHDIGLKLLYIMMTMHYVRLCELSTFLMVSFLAYLIMWGYGASYEPYTRSLGLCFVSKVLVSLDDMNYMI